MADGCNCGADSCAMGQITLAMAQTANDAMSARRDLARAHDSAMTSVIEMQAQGAGLSAEYLRYSVFSGAVSTREAQASRTLSESGAGQSRVMTSLPGPHAGTVTG